LHSDKDHQILFVGGSNTHTTNTRSWIADILNKIKKPQISSKYSTYHQRISLRDANWPS